MNKSIFFQLVIIESLFNVIKKLKISDHYRLSSNVGKFINKSAKDKGIFCIFD